MRLLLHRRLSLGRVPLLKHLVVRIALDGQTDLEVRP